MTHHLTKFAILAGTASLFAVQPALADSTYGYDDTGVSTITAIAHVSVRVAVPKLILLRVGADNTDANNTATSEVKLSPTLSAGIPGGVATVVNGNNLATGWDKTAPIFTAPTATALAAASWTNSSGGGKLTCTVSTAFLAASQLLSSHITVASSAPLTDGSLAHPGTDTSACDGSTSTTFARNKVVGSSWTYGITAAGLAAASPGSHVQTMTYTATSL